MKRLSLTDFSWLRDPGHYTHHRLWVELAICAHSDKPPFAPSFVAVSDQHFTSSFTVSSDEGLESGIMLFHTDRTFIAIGRLDNRLVVTHSVLGWSNRWQIDTDSPWQRTIFWTVDRTEEGVGIGYRTTEEGPPRPVGRFTLPGLAASITYGPYFANATDGELSAAIERFSYQSQR